MLNRMYLYCVVVYLSISYLAVLLYYDTSTIITLSKEDGFFETLGAICFLIASLFFFINFGKSVTGNDFFLFKTRRNFFFLLFAILFFFAFAEEISWGQRIFDFKTPNRIKEVNIQEEFNIHNLSIFHYSGKKALSCKLLNFNFLFNIFCLFYGGLIPFLNRFSKTISQLLKKINLPIVPIWLGICFVLTVVIFEITEWGIPSELRTAIFEVKECNLAFLFMVLSFYLFSNMRKID